MTSSPPTPSSRSPSQKTTAPWSELNRETSKSARDTPLATVVSSRAPPSVTS